MIRRWREWMWRRRIKRLVDAGLISLTTVGAGDEPLPPHLVMTDAELVDVMMRITHPIDPDRFSA